jgi:nitrogen fixation protein FixH
VIPTLEKAPSSSRSVVARWGWPVAVILVLAASAGSNIWVMFVAKADPAFAVEPEYYAKAVAWDARMAQERRNDALGWRATAALTLARPGIPGRIVVRLTETDGRPVTGATIAIEAMHNARAAQRYEAALQPADDGTWAAAIDAHRPGAWEVRLTATRGAEHFTQALRIDAAAAQH